jgi:hypothetical protein
MPDEYIKVGSTFGVVCDTTPLVSLLSYPGALVRGRRPDGYVFFLTPDAITDTTLSATISITLNPLTVSGSDPRWRRGYSGIWLFYAYVPGAGAAVFRGKDAPLNVHSEFRAAA